jgi:hypothetical protein
MSALCVFYHSERTVHCHSLNHRERKIGDTCSAYGTYECLDAIRRHNNVQTRDVIRRKLKVCCFSMNTSKFLETIVHSDSCPRDIALHMGRVDQSVWFTRDGYHRVFCVGLGTPSSLQRRMWLLPTRKTLLYTRMNNELFV